MENTIPPVQRARIRGKELYDFRIVDASDLKGYENAIWDLYKRKYDGILVRNALPAEVCDMIIANSSKLPVDQTAQMTVGWTFPPIFASLVGQVFKEGDEAGRKAMADYFQRCAYFYNHSEEALGVNTTTLIEGWLKALGGNLEVGVPVGYGGKGLYTGTTLRAYKGNGEGNISIQCGNYFHTTWQKFYEQLETQVDVYDQLSYFYMLQQPEQGGELSLYGFEWENGQGKKSKSENTEVIMADGGVRNIEDEEVQSIDPQKGDMVIFAAGQIWHRVEQVLGARERITLGGFLAYSYDKLKIYYWS
jgi:hypothetical protein